MNPCSNKPFRTALQGHPQAISPAVRQAMDYVRQSACAVGHEFEVEAALTEALANAVVHGCRGDSGQIVLLSVACSPRKGLQIKVRDKGPGFDPSAVESPLQDQNLRRACGRGIFIMRQFMDEVRYRRGGREVQLLLRPQSPSNQPIKPSSPNFESLRAAGSWPMADKTKIQI